MVLQMTVPYDTTEGPKQECRVRFIQAVAEHIADPRHFFMLPSRNAHDAILVSQHWPHARIVGVEQDTAIFDYIDRTHRNINPFRGTVRDYIEFHREAFRTCRIKPFDAAFLDYTGQASRSNVADVCEFITHFTKQVSLVGLTFTKRARHEASSVEQMVRLATYLDEDETFGLSDWNTSLNLANAVCGCLEGGIEVPDGLGQFPRSSGVTS
jgi:hypothetical protein